MAEVETKTATAVDLELPPAGGNISVALDEDAHYLRVTLDKSENFKVAAGERLRDLLVTQFGGNRNALRDWYEEAVAQGKAHRSWRVVEEYLGVVIKYGDAAATVLAEREKRAADATRNRLTRHREDARAFREAHPDSRVSNEINAPNAPNPQPRPVKSEYERRKEWLSDGNVWWFKAEREWQDRWLKDRGLSRDKLRF